jgi:hypothetical protein
MSSDLIFDLDIWERDREGKNSVLKWSCRERCVNLFIRRELCSCRLESMNYIRT